jgi:L-alanine-DL-glutamate epimerase-like enolase superfamily enzyme
LPEQRLTSHSVASVDAATVRAVLPAPVNFGAWRMSYREYVVVRVRASDGVEGWAFTLTRDGPVAAAISGWLAARYQGASLDDPRGAFVAAQRSSLASFSAGVGLRALSIVDLAVWDALARTHEVSISRLLSGVEPPPRPVTAIVGYPPTMSGEEVGAQIRGLVEAGWRRFKLPISPTPELTRARVAAAAAAAPGCSLAMDWAWIFDDVDSAVELAESLPAPLDFVEDVFPPGDAGRVAALRRRIAFPVGMGDEQGGSYYPDALLAADAVDIVRVDLTCMGGISGAAAVIERAAAAGIECLPHMFAHVHSQVSAALGLDQAPVEWGVPWTGVDPYADSLVRPEVEAGLMAPLPSHPGFGELLNRTWLAEQEVVSDPAGLLSEIPR